MPDYESHCRGKIKHQTIELAKIALRNFKRAGKRQKGYVLAVYLCAFCSFWHVGHSSTKKNRKFRNSPLARPVTVTEVNPNAIAQQREFSKRAGA